MSPSGRFVAMRRAGAIELVDVLGTAPRQSHPQDGGSFCLAGTTLCLATDERVRLLPLEGSRPARELAAGGTVRGFWGRTADAALVGDRIVTFESGALTAATAGFPLLGRAVLAATADRISISVPGRAPTMEVTLAGGGDVIDAAPLFGGKLIGLVVHDAQGAAVVVLTAQGRLVHRTRLPQLGWHAFAIERGQLFACAGERDVAVVDLRFGRIQSTGTAPHAISELAVDEDGRSVAIAHPSDDVPMVTFMRTEELLATRPAVPVIEELAAEPVLVVAPSDETAQPAWNAPAPAPRVELPQLLPLAFGAPLPHVIIDAPVGAVPFADVTEHLAALVELVAARTAMAIAEAWHTGRISGDALDHHPFQKEVLALAGSGGMHAADQLLAARDRLMGQASALSDRVLATLATGRELPFVTFARELGLSPMATQILIAVAAPKLRGELARMYRILANETNRPICDDALLAALLAADDPRLREDLACELADDAALLRHGVLRRDPRGGIEADEVALARLRGRTIRCAPGTVLRDSDRPLEELRVDRAGVERLVLELAEPRGPDAPVRIVVRGKPGAGGRSVIAALAARVGKRIACIDAAQLRGPEALAQELTRAALARAVPIVAGVDRHEADAEERHALRRVLRGHPGPLVVRTSADAEVPLDPGYVEIELRPLSESERERALGEALSAHSIAADVPRLAARYRIGPGTMNRVAADARRRLDRSGGDPTEVVDEVARQHVAARIGSAAQRVTRLATWDQVSLPEDMLDSLRELIGRARHARTVFDTWGYDRRIATARGLTALFYGPPGTGKTMIAGLIARELGLELYRVDLAKVMSKWVGETEKNLGEVFDAAEDGRLMLLFDEADSLFAKRSEVKSSNDRYANLEVNYLLQRLDAFEGVAILTTNLEGSIDPAFKRRLSMRMYFPFPDEDLRAQLWQAHIPPQLPVAGELDFAALARRFPLSGGYIRNSALRAAFLAAQENVSLSHAHLERAVLLEYRELGKLADNGRME